MYEKKHDKDLHHAESIVPGKLFVVWGNNLPGPNVTKISILSNHNAGSRATHPASSKPLKSVEEAGCVCFGNKMLFLCTFMGDLDAFLFFLPPGFF
jgi:hypothetical protein